MRPNVGCATNFSSVNRGIAAIAARNLRTADADLASALVWRFNGYGPPGFIQSQPSQRQHSRR